MSVFSSDGPSYGGQTLMKEAECKRDYEGEILRISKMSKASQALLEAVDAYMDTHGGYFGKNETFSLPTLYGMLVLEAKALGRTMGGLQAEWEKQLEREKK